jgi:hypothetical protein
MSSLLMLNEDLPQIKNARYGFTTRSFRNSAGKLLSDGMLDEWASIQMRDRAISAKKSRNAINHLSLGGNCARQEVRG